MWSYDTGGLSSHGLIRQGLVYRIADLSNYYPMMGLKKINITYVSVMLLTNGGKDIAFGKYGPEWRFQKKLVHQALR